MDWLPIDMIDALAVAWLEWMIVRPDWGCFLEVRDSASP
jgi:hypothetical protein